MEKRDLNKVVKDLKFVSKKGKSGVNYFLNLTLKNGKCLSMFCAKDFIDLMDTIKEAYGVQTSIKAMSLEDCYSEEKGTDYIGVVVTLIDGSSQKFLPSWNFKSIIEVIYKSTLDTTKQASKT